MDPSVWQAGGWCIGCYQDTQVRPEKTEDGGIGSAKGDPGIFLLIACGKAPLGDRASWLARAESHRLRFGRSRLFAAAFIWL